MSIWRDFRLDLKEEEGERMAAETKKVTKYLDRLSADRLLIPALHRGSMKRSEKPDLEGMMFEVKSEMVYRYENGEDYDFEVINLVSRYAVKHLDKIDSVDMFNAYMEQYLKRLIPVLERDGSAEFFKSKIDGVLNHIRDRFSDFKFYTGWQSYTFLCQGCPFPIGSLVIADTRASDPPTFLYFIHGLVGINDTGIERYLKMCSRTGVFQTSLAEELEKREKLKRKHPEGEEEAMEEEEEEEEEAMEEEEEDDEEEEEEDGEPREEVERESTEEEKEAMQQRLHAYDDPYKPNRLGYLFDPSKGTCYWGGIAAAASN